MSGDHNANQKAVGCPTLGECLRGLRGCAGIGGGCSMSASLTIGNTYKVNSSRKGVFTGVITQCCETWATVLITNGKAKAMLDYNEREQGEQVTVRRSFCTFTEVEGGAA